MNVDNAKETINFGMDFNLFGDGRLYFGSSTTQSATQFVGELREVITFEINLFLNRNNFFLYFKVVIKAGNEEYDVITLAKAVVENNNVFCHGNMIIKTYIEQIPHSNCPAEKKLN